MSDITNKCKLTFSREQYKAINKDLQARNATIAAFIVVDNNTNQLRYISYTNNGAIATLSRPANNMALFHTNSEGLLLDKIVALRPIPT